MGQDRTKIYNMEGIGWGGQDWIGHEWIDEMDDDHHTDQQNFEDRMK